MPNLKISELPSATLPLAGTEPMAIVQAGVTCQAPVSAAGSGGGSSAAIARAGIGGTGTVEFPGAGVANVNWDCGVPGTYEVTFTADYFGNAPIAVATAVTHNPINIAHISSTTINSCIVTITNQDGDPTNGDFNLVAVGSAGPPL